MGEGRVQIFQAGGNPQLADQLVQIVERLRSGDDLAAEIVEPARARSGRNTSSFVARGGPEPGEVLELPEAVIRQRSEPKTLKLKELWTNARTQIARQYCARRGARPAAAGLCLRRLADGIAEIDAGGKIVSRHELDAAASRPR